MADTEDGRRYRREAGPVGGTRSGPQENGRAAPGRNPEGNVIKLGRIARGEFLNDIAIWRNEGEILTSTSESEGNIQRAILPRGEDHEISPALKNPRRKDPFAGHGRIIGQGPAPQLDRKRIRIVNLNPVFPVTISVGESCFVVGNELVEHRWKGFHVYSNGDLSHCIGWRIAKGSERIGGGYGGTDHHAPHRPGNHTDIW